LTFANDDFHVVTRKVVNTIFHPKYKDNTAAYYDVAIIKLDRRVAFNDKVKPICLPKLAVGNPNVHQNKFITLTGEALSIEETPRFI